MYIEPVTGIIAEFRHFYQMMPVRPLSARAQAFWMFLLYRANAAYWQFPLQIQLNEIAGALRLSRSSVQRARDELTRQGYLLYETDPGHRTVKYYLISNVRPHSMMTAESMLAGTKNYKALGGHKNGQPAPMPMLPKKKSRKKGKEEDKHDDDQ
ncbi:helix-turn-helix domain-containing protein [Mitsuokella sp. WILCCON 0060]|uniref:helix-turn-helix domain-containing protein n=1 Tax=unclassified Mitsuokella TaxID=2637239 RepID=UPI003F0B538D